MNKLLAGLIVTFNPSDLQIKSIAEISQYFDQLYIVDNSCSNSVKKSLKMLKKININLVFNKKNYGIGFAANIFLKKIRESNLYEWALLLDQDTIINFNLRELVERVTNTNKNILGFNHSEKKITINNSENPRFTKASRLIQSGTLLRKSIYMNYLYDKNYFLDFTDFDFCARLSNDNIKMYKIENYYLQHFVGNTKINKFLFFKRKRTNHPPVNCFFMARNRIRMRKKNLYKASLKKIILSQIKEIFLTILYEEQRFQKINARVKGIIAGLTDQDFKSIDEVKKFIN